MKYRRLVVGACAMCACAFGINAVLPSNTGKNVDDNKVSKVEETTEVSGTTAVLSAGVTYYLDKLSDEQVFWKIMVHTLTQMRMPA